MEGRNLFNSGLFPSVTYEGFKVKNNGDGSFGVSGTGTPSNVKTFVYEYTKDEIAKLFIPGTYLCNYNFEDKGNNPYFQIEFHNSGDTIYLLQKKESSRKVITKELLEDEKLRIYVSLRFYDGNPININYNKPFLWIEKYPSEKVYWEPYRRLNTTGNLFNGRLIKGFINLQTGEMLANADYPNSVYTDLIYVKAGCTYKVYIPTVDESGFQIRKYNLKGEYLGSADGSIYKTTEDGYMRVMLLNGLNGGSAADFVISCKSPLYV